MLIKVLLNADFFETLRLLGLGYDQFPVGGPQANLLSDRVLRGQTTALNQSATHRVLS